jgi:hypothetical protein
MTHIAPYYVALDMLSFCLDKELSETCGRQIYISSFLSPSSLFLFLFLFFFFPLYIMHYGHIQVCIPCMHVCIQHGVYVYMHTYLPIFLLAPKLFLATWIRIFDVHVTNLDTEF